MRLLLLLGLLLSGLAACGTDSSLVVVNRLAPGGGVPGNGGVTVIALPQLDIVVRVEADASNFNPQDLMRLLVNGVNRADQAVVGGLYAVFTLDPAPVGTQQFVELFRLTGPVVDTVTYDVMPYTGPTLAGVAPDSARAGAQVTITGTGFSAGALRVFFGGIEGTVEMSSDTSITATVPTGALPGIVHVLVGADAASGLAGFQPLDQSFLPIPFPDDGDPHIFATFPGQGPAETAVRFYGVGFTDLAFAHFNGDSSHRVFGVDTINVAPVGDISCAFAVADPRTTPGAGTFFIQEGGDDSNELPFTVN